MKPTIPETGTVLSTHGDTAEVMLSGGHSCKGCGAGQIGLCRARGDSMMMTLKNDAGAAAGDTVLIGIDRKVQVSGYLLAYLIPLLSFIAGSLCGHLAGDYILDADPRCGCRIFGPSSCIILVFPKTQETR